ncbi:MAG: hypothetical protein COU71_03105 [Parcubacteria group bacterium CG10_big_fil_rev_8_21_14_0_10_38_31]|nr:MAG: hypothetical protein COU71_03105 [Parcubacteria group bacterium CG10_big_fil_rev_8_21_14_0_10_38_31]
MAVVITVILLNKIEYMSDKNNTRQLAISAIAYTSVSILGPLIIFGGIGLYLSKHIEGGKIFLFIGIGIAFIITNVLQFFKVKRLLKKMNKESDKKSGTQEEK